MSGKNAQPAGGGTGQTTERRTQRRGSFLGRLVSSLAIVVVVGLILGALVAPYKVGGTAMQPTYRDGQIVLVRAYTFLGHDFSDPARGDVALYHPPDKPGDMSIGRVIGIPGDTVVVTPDAVMVNGQTLREPYLSPAPAGQSVNGTGAPTTILGPRSYFILADNRRISSDSRVFGAVPRSGMVSAVDFGLF